MGKRNDILERKEEILNLIKNNESKSKICKTLECRPDTLNAYLIKIGISYKGNMGLKGKKNDPKRKNVIEYLKSSCVKSPILRKKLIEDNIKEYKCEICKITEWNGKKINLELHHIDFNHHNNELSNLQILCPNCHSQFPNHSRKIPS